MDCETRRWEKEEGAHWAYSSYAGEGPNSQFANGFGKVARFDVFR